MNILPEETELPEVRLGLQVDIKFTTNDGNKIVRIENLDNSTLTIETDRIHGKYLVDVETTILARKDLEYKNYKTMSEVPKGIDLYYYKPVMTRSFIYRYKVHTQDSSKVYTQKVNTDWTLLSEGVRNYARTSI